jgi:hypothetical protein
VTGSFLSISFTYIFNSATAKLQEMGLACGTCGRQERHKEGFGGET